MTVRRLIGGVVLAILLAVVFAQTAQAVSWGCYDVGWFSTCWPF